MKGTPHRQTNQRKQIRTKAEVQGWRQLMRVNKWTMAKLARHLNLSATTVKEWLLKEEYGEIRE